MKWPLLVAVSALVVVTAASAQRYGGVDPGNYTVLDGPGAGQNIYVGTTGSASVHDATSNLRVVPADDGCDDPHLVGELDGSKGTLGGCGLGRVAPLKSLPVVVRDLANAITEEERSIRSILADTQGKAHWELTLYGQLGVEHTREALAVAEKGGDIPADDAVKAGRKLDAAHAIDEKLKKDQQANKSPTARDRKVWVRDLRNALSLKRDVFQLFADDYSLLAKRCTVEKPFPVYAVPSGFDGSSSDVFPHGVPRNAKHIRAAFVDAVTGKPVPPELFPGQTWTSDVRGFRPDGSLLVRVNVTGKGFGKPDANSKDWKVVVTYDCP